MTPHSASLVPRAHPLLIAWARQGLGVLKLRIGVTITFTALSGIAITPGPALRPTQITLFGLAMLLSAAAAGGLNQFLERDLDARMGRTRNRAFVTGALYPSRSWLMGLSALLGVSVLMAFLATNGHAALYLFLGAFIYGIVYTVWLKRRTWMNVVIGGLAGSFAVLAGAAAVDPTLHPLPLWFAVILFLWTPSHFWSLAIALDEDYRAASVPMLPVLIGRHRAAQVVLANTVFLVTAGFVPLFLGLGWLYLVGALTGAVWLLTKNVEMARNPSRRSALACFHASLGQLTLVLAAAMLDAWLVSGI